VWREAIEVLGANPLTDTTHITSTYIVFELDAGDEISNLQYYPFYATSTIADWNTTEFNNQSATSTFYTVAAEEAAVVPDTPTNSLPTNASTNHSLTTLTVTSSAFSDTNAGDTHQASQWQITDTSGDYSTPLFDSGTDVSNLLSYTTSTAFTTGATYYWHVRHQDDTDRWSAYSTETSFVVSDGSAIPTNSIPTSGAWDQSTTLTLASSVFSDGDGNTHSASQWKVRTATDSDYASPVYDSGTDASNLTSIIVPSGNLSATSTYFWKVRYKDSKGAWCSYSSETPFSTGDTALTVLAVGASEYTSAETAKLTVQVKDKNGDPLNSATATIDIYDPSASLVVDGGSMTYLSGSNGLYFYNYTVPDTLGVYIYDISVVNGSDTDYSSHTFNNSLATSNLTSVKSTVESEETAQTTERASSTAERALQTTERASSTAERALQVTERASQAASRATVDTISSNMDILIGAMIVTQSAVNDASATASSFVTDLTNSTDDFYNNAVITFTSGDLDGQTRRVSDYDGSSKTITASPAYTSAPADNDTFTIVKQNVYVQEQLASHESAQATSRTRVEDIQTKVTDIQSTVDTTYTLLQTVDSKIDTVDTNIDTLITNLATVDTNIDTIVSKWSTNSAQDIVDDISAAQTAIDTLRTSQQLGYKVDLSNSSEVLTGNIYRAKLTVLDYESELTDANTVPTIVIYDSARSTATSTSMTKLSTGIYEFTYPIPADATQGTWETVVDVDLGGAADITKQDYWEVEGSPAQVLINAISDRITPEIEAEITITNEGTADYEYQYEWCVVDSEDNECGGGDDTYRATAAKLISVGEDWDTTLTATVPEIGSYWFKLLVYYGSEVSGASRTFEAVVEGSGSTATGETSVKSKDASLDDVYEKLIEVGESLEVEGKTATVYEDIKLIKEWIGATTETSVQPIQQSIAKISESLVEMEDAVKDNFSSPAFKSLLDVSEVNSGDLQDLKNKLSELRAVSSVTNQLLEKNLTEPIVEAWMSFNSVQFNFLITNPVSEEKVLDFKSFLPSEVKKLNILKLDGLEIDFDANTNSYYVHGKIKLGPNESITKIIEIEDIWFYEDSLLETLEKEAETLLSVLKKGTYEAQGTILFNDIVSELSSIKQKQDKGYLSAPEHVVAHRENELRMKRIEGTMEQMKTLVMQTGASGSLVGQVGGIQVFATWGIVIAIVFGFGLMSLVLFAMWKQQTLLAASVGATSSNGKHITKHFGPKHVKKTRRHKSTKK